MFRRVFGLLLLFVVIGGAAFYFLRNDPLREELDRRWPPVTAEGQREAAITAGLSALNELTAPNVAAGVDVATIRKFAFDAVKSKGVSKLVLATDRQLLQLKADFDVTLTPSDLPNNSEKRTLVAALAPQVAGQIALFLTAAITVSDAPQRALVVRLLPVISRIRIDKVTVKGSYDATVAADAIALLLNRYADNLSAALSASPFMKVILPATLQGGVDPSGPIKIDLKEVPGLKLSLAARPIKSPFVLRAAASLIDADKVIVVIELGPLDKLETTTGPAKGSFEELNAGFWNSLQNGLAIVDPPSGAWVALGKALTAQSLNSAFAQAQPLLSGTGPIPRETFSATIPTPDGSGIDCTPTRNCSPNRDCTPTKDCSGYKWYQAPDKLRCEAEKSGAKLDCERLKSQEKGQCELEKTGQKTACEAEKGAIGALHRTGNIGRVDGSVFGTGSLNLGFQDVHFGAGLDKLTLTIDLSGSAALDVHFKFVPLDVGGHILCPLEWTADKNITTSIAPQAILANVSLARNINSGVIAYHGVLDGLAIKLHFQPSPLSLVLQNINFNLACPVTASLINGLTFGLGPLLPEFLKDYTYKLNPVSFSFTPDVPAQSILGHNFKPSLSETSLALVVSGAP